MVFTYNIGFSMVLVMSIVPPEARNTLMSPVGDNLTSACGSYYLHPPNSDIVEKTVQICVHED